MRRTLLFSLTLLLGCRQSGSAPSWTAPSSGTDGDGTVAGAPAVLPRVATPPVIDGKLDDAVWTSAAVLGPLGDPGAGGSAEAGTFVRAAWDDRALYLGFVIRDPDPGSPFGHDDEDPHIWSRASGVEVMLQPGDPGDNRDYVELQVDAAGAVWDTRFDDYNTPITGEGAARRFGHQEWKSGVGRAVTVGAGWYAIVVALPFAPLAPMRVALPPRPGDVWRMNLYAFRDGQRHAVAWSPLRGQGNFHRASRFGRVRFGE